MASISAARPAPLNLLRSLRIPLLDSYILHEFFWPFVISFLAFFLFWGFNIFFLSAKFILAENAPFFLVFRYVLFRVPQSIPMAFPFAALFATLLGIGRLMADNEINAIRTSGVSLWRLCVTPVLFGFATFLIAWVMNEYVATRAVDLSTRTFYQIIYHTSSLPVEPQFFRKDPDTNNVFYVNRILADGKTMANVQIFKPGRSGYWNETIQAKTAHIEGATLVLNNVVLSFYNPQGYLTSQVDRSQATVGLPLAESAAEFMSSENNDAWTMNSAQLSARVKALHAQGIGGEALGNLELSLAGKLALPFAALVAVLLALPLAIIFGKKGRLTGMALSVMAFFAYYLLLEAGAALASTGRINPYLASWLPNIVFGVGGLALLWYEEH